MDFAITKSVLDVSLYLLQFWEDYGFISAGIYPSAPFIEPIFLCYADPIPPCHRFWSAYPSYVHGSPPGCGSSGNELVRFVTFYLHSGTLYQFQECVTSRRVIVRFCSCLARTTFSKFWYHLQLVLWSAFTTPYSSVCPSAIGCVLFLALCRFYRSDSVFIRRRIVQGSFMPANLAFLLPRSACIVRNVLTDGYSRG